MSFRPFAAFVTLAALAAAPAFAERPSSPRLLPDSTVAYVRIASVPEFIERFNETTIGRLKNDEQVRPLLRHLYGSAADAFAELEDQAGLSLDELLSLPQGEAALALVAPEGRRPEVVLLLDVYDRIEQANMLLENVAEQLESQGHVRASKTHDGVEFHILEPPGRTSQLAWFEKEGTVVFTTNYDLALGILQVWNEGRKSDLQTLADNGSFTAIMRRCQRSEEQRPELTFFVDPLRLAESVTRRNFNAQTTLTLLGVVGVDGLLGVGGGLTLAADDFDSIFHLHVLIEAPREGVMEALALESGDTEPEPWVPSDTATYTTFHWNAQRTYDKLAEVLNGFRGDGVTEAQAARFFDRRLGIDFEEELLDEIDGRFTLVTWIAPPARLNSQANLLGIKLKDAGSFERILDKIVDRHEDRLKLASFGGKSYWTSLDPEEPLPEDRPLRRPVLAMTVLGDYLLLADSEKLLQEAIIAKRDSSKSLAKELDYKLVASKIRRELDEGKASLITFRRPEENMRALYDLAASENIRNRLSDRSEDSRLLGALDGALRDNPLPPFAVIAKYLAPGGAMLTSDESGFHYMTFGLKRE